MSYFPFRPLMLSMAGFVLLSADLAGPAFAQIRLQAAIDSASGGVVNLDPLITYTGYASISGKLIIEGHGAQIDLENNGTDYTTLYMNTGAAATLRDMNFISGDAGISFRDNSSGVIERCSFRNISQAITHPGVGNITVADSTIDLQGIEGFCVGINLGFSDSDGSLILALNNVTIKNGQYGVLMHKGRINAAQCLFQNLITAISGNAMCQIRSSRFLQCSFSGISLSRPSAEDIKPEVVLESVFMQNCHYGVNLDEAWFSFLNCSFLQGDQGVIGNRIPGSSSKPAEIRDCLFQEQATFGAIFRQSQYVTLTGGTWDRCWIAVECDETAHAVLNDVTIDGRDLAVCGVAVAGRSGADIEIRNSSIYGHLNGVDIQNGGQAIIDKCLFEAQQFSALIAVEGVRADITGCRITNSGQDGVFYSDKNGKPAWGVCSDNVITNAGCGLPDPSIGRSEQAGTGIALFGAGPVEMERNIITGSHDLGIGLLNKAKANVRENVIQGDGFSGIMAWDIDDVTVEDNLIIGHVNHEQSGLLIGGQNSVINRVAVRRNLIAANNYGVVESRAVTNLIFQNNFITKNLAQGVSCSAGGGAAENCAFLDNADYQFFNAGAGSNVLTHCLIYSKSGLGTYAKTHAQIIDARQCFWGTASGPCNGAPSPGGGCMTHGQTTFSPWLDSSPLEACFSGDPVRGVASSVFSNSSSPWIGLSTSTPTAPYTSFAAMRPADAYAPPAPEHSVSSRPLYLWTTSAWRDLGQVSLSLTADWTNRTVWLVRYDYASGAFEYPGLLVSPADSLPGPIQIIAPASHFINGTYYFMSPPALAAIQQHTLSLQPSQLPQDTNGDGVLDICDLMRAFFPQ